MSQEPSEIVRQPLRVEDRSRRRIEQHLVRFPLVFELLGRALWRLYLLLPPRSQLRRALTRRFISDGIEAFNRRDLEAAFALYHPDVESILPPELVSLGVEPVYRGRKARVEFQERWNAEWGDWRLEPDELIQLGDTRLLVTASVSGTGSGSGAVVANEGAFLFTVSGGRAVREQIFLDKAEALKAPGLPASG